MSISASFLPEFKHEMAGLRRIIALSPADKQFDWKPHAKSMALGPLTAHLVGLAGWATVVTGEPGLDLAQKDDRKHFGTAPFTAEEALKQFDQNVAAATAALEKTEDSRWMDSWTLRAGDHVLFTMPRVQVMRTAVLNHIIHHRAQLGVYLRLQGIPVPGLYGPSADEM